MNELINGKTPEQIKEALCVCTSEEACNLYGCYYSADNNCRDSLMRDALELIKRLEAERDAAVSDLKLITHCTTCSNRVLDDAGICRNAGGGGSPFMACSGYVWDKANHEPAKEEKRDDHH